MTLKENLYKQCQHFVNQRQKTVEIIIASNKKALHSETKSSAGDKHETGRAMLQLEMEKAGQQLLSIIEMKSVLEKIDAPQKANNGRLGSIVCTNNANYFLSISAGKLIVDKQIYFAVSINSPIGKLCLGKQVGDIFYWNNETITIQKII